MRRLSLALRPSMPSHCSRYSPSQFSANFCSRKKRGNWVNGVASATGADLGAMDDGSSGGADQESNNNKVPEKQTETTANAAMSAATLGKRLDGIQLSLMDLPGVVLGVGSIPDAALTILIQSPQE